jgi:hypothetical protein
MSRKHDRLYDLQYAFEQYKKSGHGDWLADIIRVGGATNIPWPEGMAEAVADLINSGNPWTARDQTRVDDTWIYYVYWRETEYRNGKHHTSFSKFAIREVEKWFEARGTPKSYETIRSRLRYNYVYWRDSLSSDDIETMRAAAGGGGKK